MSVELAEHGHGGLWLTVTELAERQGLGKSTISEKVKALEAAGEIKTKRGRGRQKLVNLAQFLTAVGKAGDTARELGAEMRSPTPTPDQPDDAAPAPGYRDAQTRKTQFEADLRELDLLQRQGELVAIVDLVPVAHESAEAIVAVIERLATGAPEMFAAANRDGERGVRAQYRRDARRIREAIADAFNRMLAAFPATSAATVSLAEPPEPSE